MNSNRDQETSLSERTLSGLGWSYLSTFTRALLSLLVLVILARLLTPIDFGLLAIAWILFFWEQGLASPSSGRQSFNDTS